MDSDGVSSYTNRMKRCGFCTIVWCVFLLIPLCADVFDHPLSAATQQDFSAVCAQIAAHENQKGDFTQTKYLSKLNRSLVSSGTYLIARQDGIVWRTQKPFPSTMTVTKSAVIQTAASGKKSVLVAGSNPTFESFATIISSVFAGGEDLSAHNFDLFFDGTATDWTIGLVPKDATIRAVAQHFILQGGTTLRSVTMYEPTGDFVRYEFANQSFPATLTADEKNLFESK